VKGKERKGVVKMSFTEDMIMSMFRTFKDADWEELFCHFIRHVNLDQGAG
jgi:hypothetical protein